MMFSPQKLATYLLLAIYGGIAVLGHGLHELSHEFEHHAGHQHVAATGGCGHHHHGHSHAGHTHHSPCEAPSDHAVVTDGHGHACEICDFLDQNRSFTTEVTPDVSSQPLTVALSIATPRIESLAIPGLYSPRGPPAFWG